MKLHFKHDWATKLRNDGNDPETIGPTSDLSEILAEHSRSEAESKWEQIPIKEIGRLGWLGAPLDELGGNVRDIVRNYLNDIIVPNTSIAFFRRNDSPKGESEKLKSWLWLTRLHTIASKMEIASSAPSQLNVNETIDVGRELVQLSVHSDGPVRAVDFLAEKGILVIVEKTLNGSYLDGAAFLSKEGTPVIGMALRFDRIDYFWFTLLHEFVHSVRHLYGSSNALFVENLDEVEESKDAAEQEANAIAADCLIPRVIWRRCDAYRTPSKETVLKLASDIKIHPAIIVGRLRRDLGRYNLFSDLVGQNEVRRLFDRVVW